MYLLVKGLTAQKNFPITPGFAVFFTNKDIAPLINISVRGVETACYLLRKKFNLETEANLTEFLASIDVTEQTV